MYSKIKFNSDNNLYESSLSLNNEFNTFEKSNIILKYEKILLKNSYKINIIFFIILLLLSIQVINLISLLNIIKFAQKINFSELEKLENVNTSNIITYSNKIEVIINYICSQVISC